MAVRAPYIPQAGHSRNPGCALSMSTAIAITANFARGGMGGYPCYPNHQNHPGGDNAEKKGGAMSGLPTGYRPPAARQFFASAGNFLPVFASPSPLGGESL